MLNNFFKTYLSNLLPFQNLGAIYDYTGNYLGAFIGAGIPPIISAIVMTLANRMK